MVPASFDFCRVNLNAPRPICLDLLVATPVECGA